MPIARSKVSNYNLAPTGDQIGMPRKFSSSDKYYEVTCVVTMHAKAALVCQEAESRILTALKRIAEDVPYDYTTWPDFGQLDIKRTAVKQIKIKAIAKPKSTKGIETDNDEDITDEEEENKEAS